MEKRNTQVEKLCGFYVSDWHLVTMLLPYINNKIDEKTKIITILENNIEEKIKTLVEKLNLKNKEDILSINWTNINSKKYSYIENILKNDINSNLDNIILITGSKEYIERNNANIEKWLCKSLVKSIKIINFFEVTEFNSNIISILDSHDKVLNTSGEKEINEVFEGYHRGEKIEVKKVVNNSEI